MNDFSRYLILVLLFSFQSLGLDAQEWKSSRVIGPFVCWATFSLESVEDEWLALQTLPKELQDTIQLLPAQKWIEVYIFENDDQWKAFLQKEHPEIPYRRALFLKKKNERSQIFIYHSPKFINDLRHEATHALLHEHYPDLAIWLDEGLAEYFETWPRVSLHPTWWPQILSKAKENQIRKLKSLEKISGMASMSNSDYADSWAWIHYLLHGPQEVRSLLPQYLVDSPRSRRWNPLSRRLTKLYPQPDETLRRYFLQQENRTH